MGLHLYYAKHSDSTGSQRLRRLETLRRERRLAAERGARLHRLTECQSRRLARAYTDLLDNPRYRPTQRMNRGYSVPGMTLFVFETRLKR